MTKISTARLILRPLGREDLADLVRGLNNFTVSQWTARIPFPYTVADAEEFFALTRQVEEGTLRLSIARKDDPDRIVGGIGLEDSDREGTAEIGYWLAEPFWRQGYGTEAAEAIVAHAFDATGLTRLVAGYRHGNEASRRILEGLGFVATGETMTFSRAVGAETPTTRLALTRERWQKLQGTRR